MIDRNTVQVPCYIYTPFTNSLDLDTEVIGNHVDIMPTILDSLGIENKVKSQGRSLFDPAINDRISFIYSDYSRHTITGLTRHYYLFRDMTENITILSKNLSLENNFCNEQKKLCELIKTEVDNFDKQQNQRLYSYF